MAEYKRYDGYVMNIPQKFIDSKLPVCPFCGTNRPHWLLKSKMEMSLAGSRTYYRCEQCEATMSSTAADAAAEGGKNFRINPAMAAMSAAEKGTKHQEVGVAYMRVEELGRVCTEQALLHQEFPITYFEERIRGAVPAAAPAPVATPAPTPVQPPMPPAPVTPAYIPVTNTVAAPAPVANPVLSKLFMFLFILAAVNAGRTFFGLTIGRAISGPIYREIGYSVSYVVNIFGVLLVTAIAVISCILLIKASKQTNEPMKQKMWFIGGLVSLIAQGSSALFTMINNVVMLSGNHVSFLYRFSSFLAFVAPAAVLMCAISFIGSNDKLTKIFSIVTLATVGTGMLVELCTLSRGAGVLEILLTLIAVSATAVFYFFVSKSYRKQ